MTTLGPNAVASNTAGSAVLFARRFLADYARNPVNLVFIVVVPVVFVVVAAGSLTDLAKIGLFGRAGTGAGIQTATAGWSAGFLSATAMYFQIAAARAADRRLVLCGLSAARLVAARLAAGLALAALASSAALAALAARTGGIQDVGRVAAGTAMFAVIYLGIGALIGALVRNPLNGTLLILLVWMLEVFLGPFMGGAGAAATRVFPTHFVSLWMTGAPSGHAGAPGDLGWALAWTLGALAAAFTVVARASRTAAARRSSGARPGHLRAAVRAGLRDWGRNRVLWILLVVIPAVYLLMTKATTQARPVPITVTEQHRQVTETVNLASLHPALMAPIAVASLAAIAGMFIILDSRAGDARLALAGARVGTLLTARLTLVALATALATTVSLAVTAAVSTVHQWGLYIAANALMAATYALLGVLIGPLLGRVGGVFTAFLVPFIDLGVAQDPMLRASPPAWAHFLPGYGADRVLIDAILTPAFDDTGPLLIALAWLAALLLAAALVFRHTMPAGRRARSRSAAPAPAASKG